jgi:histidine triad (HIT) family protein
MEPDCIFCKIASGGTDTEFVYQDDQVVVFRDIHPHAPVHLLVVPRRHIRSVNDLTEEDATLVARMMMVAKEAARLQGVNEKGYKLLFNVEWGAGQRVFHLHLHLLAGKKWGGDG